MGRPQLKPLKPLMIQWISPIIYTVVNDKRDLGKLIEAGVDIFNVAGGKDTAKLVRWIREKLPYFSNYGILVVRQTSKLWKQSMRGPMRLPLLLTVKRKNTSKAKWKNIAKKRKTSVGKPFFELNCSLKNGFFGDKYFLSSHIIESHEKLEYTSINR